MASTCFEGLLGQGKTYNMVAAARRRVKESRPQVYTNMAGLSFPESIYISNIEELCDINAGLVLLDEMMLVCPAQFWQDIGRDLLGRFAQLRKHGLDLYYTAQLGDGVNKTVRELTDTFVMCRRAGRMSVTMTHLHMKDDRPSIRVRRFNDVDWGLYDTLETIGTHGGSTGLTTSDRPLSCVARARSARDADEARRTGAALPPPIYYQDSSGLWCLTRAAERAREHLVRVGAISDGEAWSGRSPLPSPEHVAGLIRTEMRRQAWLRHFNYCPADAPLDCLPETPWLKGVNSKGEFVSFDPVSVTARRLKAEAKQAEADAVAASRRSRSFSSGRSYNGS